MGLCHRQRSSEEQDVRFRLVNHVMHPSLTLLNTQIPPFCLGHQMGLRDSFSNVLRKHDMPVLELIVVVFIGVINLLVRHCVVVSGRSRSMTGSRRFIWSEDSRESQKAGLSESTDPAWGT